eukprot:5355622-Pleurochrysis_carterae.AAC.1
MRGSRGCNICKSALLVCSGCPSDTSVAHARVGGKKDPMPPPNLAARGTVPPAPPVWTSGRAGRF